MARYSVPSARPIAVAAIVMLLGAVAAVAIAAYPGVSPERVSMLQTPGLGNINVTVVDNAGRIMDGATVFLNGTAYGISDENGTVLIIDLPPNETDTPYSISANKLGYLSSDIVSVVLGENETVNKTLMIRGGWIIGSILSEAGPIPGANVSIGAPLGYSANASPENGTFILEGLPSGAHTLTAGAPGYEPDTQTVTVPLGGIAFAYFELDTENGWIYGYTNHSATGEPLEATNVSVQIGTTTVTVQSEGDGSYVITGVPEGNYTVTASREGFNSTSRMVEVFRGEGTPDVNFLLEPKPTRLYGVVRSGQVLLVGANVSIDGTAIFVLSGADGNYIVRDLEPGLYNVTATLQGYETLTMAGVTITPGSEIQLNFNMTGLPGARLRGIVKDSRTNAPLANVLVTAMDIAPQPRSVFTNINGEFEFTALTAGNYTLRFEKTGYRPLEIGELEAAEGSSEMIEFQLTPLRESFEGFIEGLDLAHSMMVVALALTLTLLAVAIVLRIRAIVSPKTAPGVYDQAEEEQVTPSEGTAAEEGPDMISDDSGDDPKNKKVRKLK